MIRYKIILEYLGTDFVGWQKQNNHLSIQECLESAIYQFSKENPVAYASGRTDAGVHALGQVCHFDLSKEYDAKVIIRALNHFLKAYPIVVKNCAIVNSDFHSRFSAISRRYTYKINNGPTPLAIEKDRMWWVRYPLNTLSMQEGANYLIGQHDFTSFRATECQAKSPIKTITNITISQDKDIISIEITAPSFLHHMVRNIVGTLMLVGTNKWLPIDVKYALEAKIRSAAGMTAPACGLYFTSVTYKDIS